VRLQEVKAKRECVHVYYSSRVMTGPTGRGTNRDG